MTIEKHNVTQFLLKQARQNIRVTSQFFVDKLRQYRIWSIEKEITLIIDFEKIKDSHWTRILVIYKRDEKINEVLKNRNANQFRDKARNLKNFFIKYDFEISYHLLFI